MSIRRIAALGLFSGICLATIAGAMAQNSGQAGAGVQPGGTPTHAPDSSVHSPAPAAPATHDQPDAEQFMKMVEEQSKPVAAHDILAAFDGTWNMSCALYINGGDAMKSEGATTNTWILGNRFMQLDGRAGDAKTIRAEFQTTYGYDSRIQKYTVIALDTLGTYAILAVGDYDAASKTLTLLGVNDEGGRQMDFRWIVKFETADRITQRIELKLLPEEPSTESAAAHATWATMSEVTYMRKK